MAKREIKLSDIKGYSLYPTKNGAVWYDFLTKKGYILTSTDAETFLLYSSLFPISIVVPFILYSMFSLKALYAVILGVVIYVFGFFFFRFKYFYNYPVAENWEKPKKNIIDEVANNFSRGRIIALIIGSTLITVLCYIDVSIDHLEGTRAYTMYGLSIVGLVLTIGTLIALIKQIRKNK